MGTSRVKVLSIVVLFAISIFTAYLGLSYGGLQDGSEPNLTESTGDTIENNNDTEPEPYWTPENESRFSEAIKNRSEGQDISEWWPEDIDPPKVTDEQESNITRGLSNSTVSPWGPGVEAEKVINVVGEGDREDPHQGELERGTYGFFARHEGDGEFKIEILNDNGGVVRTPVETTGKWNSRKVFHLDSGAYSVRVRADGLWSWTLSKLKINNSVGGVRRISRSGKQSGVFGPFQVSETSTVKFILNTSDNAEVYLLRRNFRRPVTLINTSGPSEVNTMYSETIPHYIVVDTKSDDWRLSLRD